MAMRGNIARQELPDLRSPAISIRVCRNSNLKAHFENQFPAMRFIVAQLEEAGGPDSVGATAPFVLLATAARAWLIGLGLLGSWLGQRLGWVGAHDRL